MARISQPNKYVCPQRSQSIRIYDNELTRKAQSRLNVGARQSVADDVQPKRISVRLGIRTTQQNSPLQNSYVACVLDDGAHVVTVTTPVGNISQQRAGFVAWNLMLNCVKPYKNVEYDVTCMNGNIVDPNSVKQEFNRYSQEIHELLVKTAALPQLKVVHAESDKAMDAILKVCVKNNKYNFEMQKI